MDRVAGESDDTLRERQLNKAMTQLQGLWQGSEISLPTEVTVEPVQPGKSQEVKAESKFFFNINIYC